MKNFDDEITTIDDNDSYQYPQKQKKQKKYKKHIFYISIIFCVIISSLIIN